MLRLAVPGVFSLFLVTCFVAASPKQTAASPLITEGAAARHGLTRPWFAQAAMDPGRSRLSHIELYDGTLYVQSNHGLVQAIDAETGATLWSKQIGRPNYPTLPLGVGKLVLAVVNGSQLYILNRRTGELLQNYDLEGAPGAGPAVSDQWIYVPLLSATIVAYHFEQVRNLEAEQLAKKKSATEHARRATAAPASTAEGAGEGAGEDFMAAPPATPPTQPSPVKSEPAENLRLRQESHAPLRTPSKGRAMVQPRILFQNESEEYVAWSTDAGYLYIGRVQREKAEALEIRFRMETTASISVPAVYVPADPRIDPHRGVVITASNDGSLTALLDRNGELLWHSALGESVVQPLVAVDDRVYAATQFGGLHCVDVKTGGERWSAPEAFQFVAQSKSRVYAGDRIGRLLILDAATGAVLGRLDVEALPLKLTNAETDRIYLGSGTGLIQCLHELDQKEPISYRRAEPVERKPAEPPKIQQKGAEATEPAAEGPGKAAEPERPKAKPAEPLKAPPKKPEAKKPAPEESGKGDKTDKGEEGENPFKIE
jgi:outer membrane protein assembly factor BamB